MAGKLYIVATPIGNREDITLRAIKTLEESDIILAEDTRSARKLLSFYNINAEKILSLFEGNEAKRIPTVLRAIKEAKIVSLISESGTPLINDPGYKLVQTVIKHNLPIETVPGCSAVTAALSISGLPASAFLFLGFLPKKQTKASLLLKALPEIKKSLPFIKTIIFYESPHRLLKTLHLIKQELGNIEIVICRELTKLYEEVRRENVVQSIKHFSKTRPKGEFTVLLYLR